MMARGSAKYFEMLGSRCETIQSSLCIGLDPDPRRIPRHLGRGPDAIYKFCVEIIEATCDLAAVFKPNIAFFESIGAEGLHVLEEALKAVPEDVPVIVDAKRGDIGSTAQHYARALFDRLKADAVTVNPLLGFDSVEPFIERERSGVYILCLTSNEGARDFQLIDDLYLKIARKVNDWNTRGNCGMVVGATKPQYLKSILAIAPDVPLLIPGLGAQGGDLESIMDAARGRAPHQLIFNISRSIIYAADDKTFAYQARRAARYYNSLINSAREKTLAALDE
jgi:orotidine-5'-phosphate decarboxylase